MFLGYQNDKIAFIADTQEELENLPCVTLDKIEETTEEYILHNGEYLLKSEATALQNQEEIEKQIKELKPVVAEKINLSLEEIFMQEMKGEDYDYKSILY